MNLDFPFPSIAGSGHPMPLLSFPKFPLHHLPNSQCLTPPFPVISHLLLITLAHPNFHPHLVLTNTSPKLRTSPAVPSRKIIRSAVLLGKLRDRLLAHCTDNLIFFAQIGKFSHPLPFPTERNIGLHPLLMNFEAILATIIKAISHHIHQKNCPANPLFLTSRPSLTLTKSSMAIFKITSFTFFIFSIPLATHLTS